MYVKVKCQLYNSAYPEWTCFIITVHFTSAYVQVEIIQNQCPTSIPFKPIGHLYSHFTNLRVIQITLIYINILPSALILLLKHAECSSHLRQVYSWVLPMSSFLSSTTSYSARSSYIYTFYISKSSLNIRRNTFALHACNQIRENYYANYLSSRCRCIVVCSCLVKWCLGWLISDTSCSTMCCLLFFSIFNPGNILW